MSEIFDFSQGRDAYEKAKRMASKGHRDWLVWRVTGGIYRTARAGVETVQQAIYECEDNENGRPIFACIHANTGQATNVSRIMAAIWLENMRSGHL